MRTLAVLAGIVLSVPCSGTMLLIDSFKTDQPLVSAPGSNGVRSAYAAQSALDAIGGHRELVVSRNSGGGSVTADVGITLPAAFNYASAAFARGSAVVKWEGTASDSTSAIPARFALRADLTNEGRNSAVFFGAYSDLGVDVTLTFYQSASRFVTAVVRVAPGYDPEQEPVLTDFYVPFSEFSTTGVLSPLNVFADARAITMSVAGKSGADAVITTFGTVDLPEPRYVCVAGLLAIVVLRRATAS